MNAKLFLEIKDEDFYPNHKTHDTDSYVVRRASRGIVTHGSKTALLHVTKHNYHKLPGGGIEKDENIEVAFKREILEEVGCNCEVLDDMGLIVEWRDQFKLVQFSYIFAAKVTGQIGKNTLMADEIEEGMVLKWIDTDEALHILKSDKPTNYEGKFIQKRDLYVFEHYLDKSKSA